MGIARRALRLKVLRWPLALAVVLGAAWLLRGFDLARLRAALADASWPLVALAAAINVTLNVAARTMRWRSLLPPSPRTGQRVSFVLVAEILLASQAVNTVLPFRAGEALRTVALTDRAGYTVRVAIAAQVVEKLVEGASLATLAVPIVLSPSASGALLERWVVLVALVVACLALLAAARRAQWLRQTADAVHVLGKPRAGLQSYAWALASDLVDLATIALSAAALGIELGPAAWCTVLLGVNLAIAVPTTPAQVGVLEAGAVLVLVGLGVERDRALAFALVYHGVHVVPFTIAGGLALATSACRDRREAAP